MQNRKLHKLYYHVRHRYLTTNNVVMLVAFFVALSWTWGSIGVMERNYKLQADLSEKEKQLQLMQLETQTLKLQNKYYQSDEYKELEVRRRLGLVAPGEKVLILPPNSAKAKASTKEKTTPVESVPAPSNVEQWVNFLFGGNSARLNQ